MNFSSKRLGVPNGVVIVAAMIMSLVMFLISTRIGGMMFGAILFSASIGALVGHLLNEPRRIRQKVRERTMALQDLAYRDGLTGLPNRRFFIWYLSRYLPRKAINGQADSLVNRVVLFDLNGFKAVNDTYGHEAGDELLKLIADTLNKLLPPEVLLARLGGDEFVVFVRDRRQGRKITSVVNTIRQAASSALLFGHDRIQVSASVGVSSPSTGRVPVEQLLREADELMYLDKAAQRTETSRPRAMDRRTRRSATPVM